MFKTSNGCRLSWSKDLVNWGHLSSLDTTSPFQCLSLLPNIKCTFLSTATHGKLAGEKLVPRMDVLVNHFKVIDDKELVITINKINLHFWNVHLIWQFDAIVVICWTCHIYNLLLCDSSWSINERVKAHNKIARFFPTEEWLIYAMACWINSPWSLLHVGSLYLFVIFSPQWHKCNGVHFWGFLQKVCGLRIWPFLMPINYIL